MEKDFLKELEDFKQISAAGFLWSIQRNIGWHQLITTAGVNGSPTVRVFASFIGVQSSHFISVYTGHLSISTISIAQKY